MIQSVFSFADLNFGSKLIQDLIGQKASVLPFAGDYFSLRAIEQKIERRKTQTIDRKALTEALLSQNAHVSLSEASSANMRLISSENTFTITTGHQLNVLTGPLFTIYKIAQAIVIAGELKRHYPIYNFVPVFWMATEDHDFEEINHIHLFNRKIVWHKPDQEAVIAGRLSTPSLAAVFDEIEALYQQEALREKIQQFRQVYLNSGNLAEATRQLVNHLFGHTGLLILDGNDATLKKQMVPVFQREIKEQLTHAAVTQTNGELATSGYHHQVHVRNCNLFFIHENGKRERIVFENAQFGFGGNWYAANELEKMIVARPADFSPNALLRPVYQELILPNLTYIGGGGEIAYWLQLRSLFEALNVSFPLLRVRDSVFLLNTKQADELAQAGLQLNELQQPIDVILKKRTLERMGDDLSFSEINTELDLVKQHTLEKVRSLDPGLSTMVEAEFVRMATAIEKIESKLIKSAKTKDEASNNRLIRLQEKLFPEGHFQERHENFLNYYLSAPEFIEEILETIQADDEPKIRIKINP